MRRLLPLVVLGLWVAGVPAAAAADGEVPAVAILDLSNDTGDASFDSAGPGVAAILLTKFTRTSALRVVERSALQAISDEIDLGASGLVDPATAARAGKLVGADFVVAGSLFTVKLPAIAVSVRVVDVETGEVVAAEEVHGEVGERGEEFFVLIDELAYLVLDAVEVRLAGRERVEFNQIDVRNLETVGLFGSALQALDRGDKSAAEGLLGRALALEPGFTLAADTLASIAADISQRRSDVAHESVIETRALWDSIRAISEGADFASDAGCRQAIRARLMLIEGQYKDFLAEEAKRLDDTVALLQAIPWDDQRSVQSGWQACWRETLQKAGADRVRTYQYNDEPFWPYEIKMGMADVLVRLGSRDEAAALAVDAWQHRGPQGSRGGKPQDPQSWADRADLHDLAVVLQQQRLRAAELRGDADATRKALDELEDLVEDAQSHAAQKGAWDEFVLRAAREPGSDKLLDAEKRALRYIKDSLWARRAAYADFCRRVDDGWYDAVRVEEPRDFKNLAKSWRKVADSTWGEWWDLERQLSHLVVFQAQAPPTTEEEEEAYREALERFVTAKFRP